MGTPTVATVSARSGARSAGQGPGVVGPPKGAVRPVGRVALAVLLMVGGAAVGAALYLASGDRTQVVVAARDIPVGTIIGEQDLAAAELAGEGVSVIAGSDARRLLGQTATTRIPAGALLHGDMVDPLPPPGPGQVAVGVALTAGQLPAAELAPGRQVQVLLVPQDATTTQDPDSSVLVQDALVLSVSPDPSGAWLVTLAVDSADATKVSAGAALKRVSLGLLPYADGTYGTGGSDGSDGSEWNG